MIFKKCGWPIVCLDLYGVVRSLLARIHRTAVIACNALEPARPEHLQSRRGSHRRRPKKRKNRASRVLYGINHLHARAPTHKPEEDAPSVLSSLFAGIFEKWCPSLFSLRACVHSMVGKCRLSSYQLVASTVQNCGSDRNETPAKGGSLLFSMLYNMVSLHDL